MAETARVIDITDDIKQDTTVVAVKQEHGNVPATIAVIDNDSCELANQRVLSDTEAVKKIHEKLDDKKERARKVWMDWNDLIKELCAPWEKDKAFHVDQVKKYRAEIKRKQEEEAARLREIARKEEEERRLREAEALEKEGRPEEAEEILSEPITYVAPAPVKMETPRVDNRMYRTQIKVRVKDRMVFLAKVPPDVLLVCLNEAAWTTIESGLSKKARALGKAFSMQGTELYEA